MARLTIQVSPEVKRRVQKLKDELGMKNESDVVEWLLNIDMDLEPSEIKIFMQLRSEILNFKGYTN